MRRPTILFALVILALLGAMAAKSVLIRVPPVRVHSEAGTFDASRAKARLAVILGNQQPHPTDTSANDQVRQRIIAQLSGMGLRPIVRDQRACNELYKSRGVSCARVRNIVVMLGPERGKALLLSAHYDSTPVGPGAGDAGIGVATLLEVGSILKDRPLRRPIMLLFNEGEELGLVGARAFLADPLSRNVDSLINLEARGVEGPVNMFETSRPNGTAIEAFKASAGRPVANSLSTDVYRLMPNYTDVNTFGERRWLTLNFAPIGNETRYHSPGDTVDALSTATLQHMGDQTLAAAQELSSRMPQASGNLIFMDIASRALLVLPLAAGASILLGLLVGFTLLAWRSGQLVRGLGVVFGTLLIGTAVTWLALAAIGAVRQGAFWRAHPEWTHLATYGSVIAAAALLMATVGRGASTLQLRSAFWLVYAALGALIGLFAPGGIVYFLLPPFLALAGQLASRWWRPAESLGAFTAIAFLYLSWGAMLALLEELLNSGPMWIFAPLGGLLILPVMVEARALIHAAAARAVTLSAVLALALWAGSASAPAYSVDRQQRFVIEHVVEPASGKAHWSVLNGKARLPAGYQGSGQWRWEKLPHADGQRWVADAPAVAILPPAIETVGVTRNGGERHIRLRLRPNGSERVTLIASDDARIRAAGTENFVRPIDAAAEDGKYLISCFGRSCDGMVIDIVTARPEPFDATIVGARRGLPQSAAPLVAARPKLARPQYAPDQTIVFSRMKL